ncbi:MAG: type II secretion system protein GspG [Deltaproteobacteria bacterium]|nr:type II secretion system protein GspG [Deltaproteobacteria bacterium]
MAEIQEEIRSEEVRPEKNRKQGSKIILWIGILLAALGVLGLRLYVNNKAADEQALIAQLQAIRGSIHLYVALSGAFPPDLQALTTQKYTVGRRSSLYLTGVEVDGGNYPLDPFGHRFQYDPTAGRVWPGTESYQSW